jgi:hypothetical protein
MIPIATARTAGCTVDQLLRFRGRELKDNACMHVQAPAWAVAPLGEQGRR